MILRRFTLLLALASAGALQTAGCSDDPVPVAPSEDTGDGRGGGRTVDAAGEAGTDAEASETGNPDATDAGDGIDDAADAADATDAQGSGDAIEDVPPEETTPDPCDIDGDGFESEACGGDDCDDGNIRVSPGVREVCDFIDNDCNGRLNNGIDCTFFAHTADQLFEVDPFQASIVFITDAPDLFDFDTDTSGTLWGISPEDLFRFDSDERRWVAEASLRAFSTAPNGFAIDSRSQAYATGGNELYGIDLDDGSWELIGSFGGPYISSGDCVVDKNDVLFMTSKHLEDEDTLVRVDTTTGAATNLGSVGFRGVYGLTAAWGFLFGMTSSGELLELNADTGEGRLIHTFEGQRWFGAASSAGR